MPAKKTTAKKEAAVLGCDTWLYHKDEGAKLFCEGDNHPGAGWKDTPQG